MLSIHFQYANAIYNLMSTGVLLPSCHSAWQVNVQYIVNFERKMSEFIAMYFCNSLNSVNKPEEYHDPFDEGFA